MATDRDRCTGAQALPLGRKVPRGSERWYLVRCGEGRELAACAAVARLVPAELLRDAFVPRKERSAKRQGVWREDVAPLFPGHFVAVTADAPALAEALSALTLRVSLVGQVGRGYAPIAREVQDFLGSAMDGGHVVRFSSATVGPDGLRVERGPLVGQEWRIANFEARRRYVRVALGGTRGDGQFSVTLPIDIRVGRGGEGELAHPGRPRRVGAGRGREATRQPA